MHDKNGLEGTIHFMDNMVNFENKKENLVEENNEETKNEHITMKEMKSNEKL